MKVCKKYKVIMMITDFDFCYIITNSINRIPLCICYYYYPLIIYIGQINSQTFINWHNSQVIRVDDSNDVIDMMMVLIRLA